MITAVDIAILRVNPKEVVHLYCIYHLNSPENLSKVNVSSSGTTRPRITRRDLSSLPIIKPPIELQQEFNNLIEPSHHLKNHLKNHNDNLRKTRDILLPKLISGEVDVENVDLKLSHENN
jgi:type I restriction enzyme S subunit